MTYVEVSRRKIGALDFHQNLTMKTAVIASLIASATAFAPASQQKTSSALSASNFANELGVITPTGFFDPLGLSNDIDQEQFDAWRALEIKHGRISMLAVVGYVVPEFYRWPGLVSYDGTKFADVPNGLAAIKGLPPVGWAQMFAIIGMVDLTGVWGDFEVGKPVLAPEVAEKRQLQEIQHGRLAMLAILELLRHDITTDENLITGFPFLYN